MSAKLRDVLTFVNNDRETIVLFLGDEWIGTFPSAFIPDCYDNYLVGAFAPDKFDGEGFGDGIVLKVWLEIA
jgi:hypothetical protein